MSEVNRYYCYPVECVECGETLARAEDNGALGRGDTLALDGDGEPLCDDHPELVAFVAAGTYAFGGGTPCEPNNRAFSPEDVTEVERRGVLARLRGVFER